MSEWYRFICVSFIALCLIACAPLPVTYYQPSAEGAKIVWARCDQAPPYMAEWNSGKVLTTAQFGVFESGALVLSFVTSSNSSIALDPAELEITADGKPVSLDRLTYRTTSSQEAKEVAGRVEVVTDTLYLQATVSKKGPEEVTVKIPPLTVNGEPLPIRYVQFRKERKVKLRFLILNC